MITFICKGKTDQIMAVQNYIKELKEKGESTLKNLLTAFKQAENMNELFASTVG